MKQAGDEMSAALAEATKSENDAIAAYEGLIAARKERLQHARPRSGEKTVRTGVVAVSIAQMKNAIRLKGGSH